jgi:hypothetical protein
MNEEKVKEKIGNNAYLACIFDFKGHIGIRKREPQKGKREINCTYSGEFLVSFRNEDVTQWIVKTFGGKVREWKHTGEGIFYGWRPAQDEILHVLLKIQPFLHQKKEQVECLIDFYNDCKKGERLIFTRLATSELALRESYYLKMKDIKKREKNGQNRRV